MSILFAAELDFKTVAEAKVAQRNFETYTNEIHNKQKNAHQHVVYRAYPAGVCFVQTTKG